MRAYAYRGDRARTLPRPGDRLGRRSELIDGRSRVDEAGLGAPIVPGFPSVYVPLHGLVQDDVYHHARQIVLLKKTV